MPFFKYKARTSESKIVAGLVEAPAKDGAVKLLREKSLFVVELSETKAGTAASKMAQFKRVKFGDVVNFTRQLATMITAGLSLPESLTILRSQTNNQALAQMLQNIEHEIMGGGNLADALARYPQTFPPIYVALVGAGEASGSLDQVLTRLAETLEAQREFRGKIIGALIYPVIILIGMVVVVMIMMVVVIPKLTELYRDFGITLPFSTRLLMAISSFFVNYWILMILGTAAASIAFARWKKTPVGEYMVDSAVLRIPVFGDLQKKVILVEFTRTLGMLISSGIHILEGLRILKGALTNVRFRTAIDEISEKVEKGFSLGDSFAQYEMFPPIVSQMMKVGEETGRLDETMGKLSKYFQSETEHLVKGLTTAIEPIIMVILGVGVGFIVMSVITPIYNLTSQFK